MFCVNVLVVSYNSKNRDYTRKPEKKNENMDPHTTVDSERKDQK